MAAMLQTVAPAPASVNFLATPYWVAIQKVEVARRAGRRPAEFYLRVLEAHAEANAAWYAEQDARQKEAVRRQKAWRRARGGAFGKDQSRW